MELWQIALIFLMFGFALWSKSFIFTLASMITTIYGIYIATTLYGDPNIYFLEGTFLIMFAFHCLLLFKTKSW